MKKIELPVWLDRRWVKCPHCGSVTKTHKWVKRSMGKQTIAVFNGKKVEGEYWFYCCPACWQFMSARNWLMSQFKGGLFRPGNGFEVM